MKIKDKLQTQLFFDGQVLWYITYPPALRGRPQVMGKRGLDKVKTPVMFSVFKQARFMDTFRFVSSRKKGRTRILQFQARETSGDMQGLQDLLLQVEALRLLKLKIRWRALSNEEEYQFSNIRPSSFVSPLLQLVKRHGGAGKKGLTHKK